MRGMGILTAAVLMTSSAAVHGSMPLPEMSEDQAYSVADLIADVTVLSVTPLVDDGSTNQTASTVSVRILTHGVCTKETISIRWDQRVADATWRKIAPPLVGQEYRAFLSDCQRSAETEFEGVHPFWAFSGPLTNAPTTMGFVEHVVKPGDTLYGLAGKYYGRPLKWNVIRLANFAHRAEGEVYPLRVGMTIRVPVFLINRKALKKEPDPSTAPYSEPAVRSPQGRVAPSREVMK